MDRALAHAAEEEEKKATEHLQLSRRYRRAACRFWSCSQHDLPLPYPWNKERDRRVLEAVLLGMRERLLSAPKANAENDHRGRAIHVDEATSIEMFENWYHAGALQPEGLPIDVAADLQRRNAEGEVALAELGLQSPGVVVRDLDEPQSDLDPVTALGWIYVSLPGYSRDGRLALVAVRNAFAQHPSGRVYALRLDNHGWRIAGVSTIHGE
jgi:hypothetical protein